MYWLQQLQKARREFALSAGSRASVNSQVCSVSESSECGVHVVAKPELCTTATALPHMKYEEAFENESERVRRVEVAS